MSEAVADEFKRVLPWPVHSAASDNPNRIQFFVSKNKKPRMKEAVRVDSFQTFISSAKKTGQVLFKNDMNKIFKSIWNNSRGCFVAVSEAVSSHSSNNGQCVIPGLVLSLVLSSANAMQVQVGTIGQTLTGGTISQNEDFTFSGSNASTETVGLLIATGADVTNNASLNFRRAASWNGLEQPITDIGFKNDGTFTNNGELNFNGGNGDYGSFSHAGDGFQMVNNGHLINRGTISIRDWFSYSNGNAIGFQNNGVFDNYGTFTIPRYENDYNGTGKTMYGFWNTGTFNHYSGTFYIKNDGGKKTASNQFFYNTGTMNLWGPMNFEGNFSHGKLTNKGGTINSIAANFVSIAAGAPIPLDVIDPSNAVTTITANSYRGESTLGETPEWYPHMVFDGGTLNIIDYAPSSPVAAKLREKFNGQNGAQLIFSGSRTSMAADEWNLATIRAIQAEGFNDYIFYRNDLNAQNAGVNVGNSSSIANNIGFRTINGTSSISVTNGRRLTVTGIGSGYAVDRDVSISNGTLRLGHSSVGTNGGSIHNIAFSGGALEIARGAWLGSTVQGNGNLSVAQNSSLGLAEIKNIDCITNSGTLSVSRDVAVSGTINNTGYLTVSNLLKFGTNAKLINNGGTLQTNNVFNIFDSVGSRGAQELKYVSLGASTPQAVKTSLNEFFKQYLPGTVAQTLARHASFTGGKVVVTGVTLTTTQRDDLTKAFKAQFGSATTLEFQGNISGLSSNDILTVAKANELYNNVGELQNVTILSHTLEGEASSVEIGENGVKHSAGFKGVNDAASITVKDGKTLELVGEKGESSNFVMTAVNTVVDGLSKLVLGSKGLSETYSGKVAEVQLTQTNASLLAAAGMYEVQNVSGSGSVEVDQGAKLAVKAADHSGSLNVKGSLEVKGDANFGETELSAGSSLNNSANLHLASITQSQGSIYNQTGGSIQSDSGWFENSTLNISGGYVDGSLIKDSNGNAAGLGNNTINISGAGKNPIIVTTDPAESKKNWKDSLTVVYAPELTSETKVNIYAGGVLQADKLSFDGTTENSVVLAGGALETKLDQVFNDVKRDLLTIDGTDSSGQIGVPTHVLGATSVGSLKDDVKTAIQGSSGLVVFNDQYLKMSGVVQAMQNFAAEAENPGTINPDNPSSPGDTSDGLYLAFTGQVDGKLTVDLANQFDTEQTGGGALTGVVLSHTKLYNESTSDSAGNNRNLVIGFNEHNHENANVIDVNNGIGFLSVEGADQVHIESGKEFTLVGHHDDDDIRTDEDRNNVHSVPDSVLFNENTALIKNDNNDGGHVEVSGKFTYGSFAAHTPTLGWIGSLQIHESGEVEAKNGEYAVWDIENNGKIHINKGSILHSHNYTGNGDWLNEGQIWLGNSHSGQVSDKDHIPFEIKGKFENAEGAIFSSANKTNLIVSNELLNKGTGLYSVLTVAKDGSSHNKGEESGKAIDVQEGGKHVNEGSSFFKKVSVAGLIQNFKDFVIGSDSSTSTLADPDTDADADQKAFEVAVGGRLENKGNLAASGIQTSQIAGELDNTGVANYNDMVIAATGSSTTSNYEKGEWLTVNGTHSNSKVSIWNRIDVAKTGKQENSGSLDVGSSFNVAGEFVNTTTGVLDASKVENTEVSGTLTNAGHAQYKDMTIAVGGDSINSGYEKGQWLKIEDGGSHSNSGVSIWNGLDVAGDMTNEKDGNLDATQVENTLVTGNLTNDGTANYDDMTIKDGGVSDNRGYEKGDIKTVGPDGTHKNSGTSIWNEIKIDGGIFENTGKTDTDKLTIDDGKVELGGGELNAKDIDLNGGDLVIGNDKPLSEENKAQVEFVLESKPIDTNIYVKNNGDLGLGEDALDFADVNQALGIPDVPSRLVVTEPVVTGPGGGIAVGSEVWTNENEHVQIGNGDLYFADGSYTVVKAPVAADTPIFTTTSDIAKVTVEPGATLVLGGLEEPGDYSIVSGFITTGNEDDTGWIGGWIAKDNLYALAQQGTGLEWILTLHNDPKNIWVNAQLADVRTLYPDIVIPNNVNKALNGPCSGGVDEQLICKILKDQTAGRDLKTKLLNSIVMIGQASGALSITNDLADNATDSIEKHLSFRDYGYANGYLKDYSGLHLWADILGTHLKTKSLDGAGNMTGGYKASAGGLVLGADHQFEAMPSVRTGLAASFQKGKADSLGDYIDTKNKFSQWMLHGYVAKDFGNELNWISSINVGQNISKASQGLPSWSGFSKAEARIKNTVANVATKLEKNIQVTDNFQVVPHVGARWLRTHTQGYTTSLNGQKAFSYGQTSTNLLQLPVGVGLQGEVSFGRWTVRPQADLTLTYSIGNLKNSTKVSGVSIGEMDSMSNEFAGRFSSKLQAGLQVERGNVTGGLQLGLTKGSAGKLDTGLKLEGRYRF
ncbi:autotransporter domain-containing protein [uncultured Parasutterella sp.]|uniref:autotransporter domain-containing protein n=1 Tax=uncultured Parasutterella sp. TaxID=1263098 RepID=UPI00258CE6FD|nr:autotransporter domain-containing protein [uncultured Parasutterella sp.]